MTVMTVRKPEKEEISPAVRLARNLGVDYPGMETDQLWVAEESGRFFGVIALKIHPDCLELCALGVDSQHRRKGLGRALVEALMKEAPGEVHLGTTIPAFFERQGFQRTAAVPVSFADKYKSGWCDGCAVDRCMVMVRRKA